MEPSDTATSDFTAAAVVEEDVSLFLEGLGRLFVTNSIYPESHPRCRDVAESVFEEVQGLTRGGIEVTLTVEEESFQLQSQTIAIVTGPVERFHRTLSSLTLERIEFAPETSAEDVNRLSALLQDAVRNSLRGSWSVAEWSRKLPPTIRASQRDYGTPTLGSEENSPVTVSVRKTLIQEALRPLQSTHIDDALKDRLRLFVDNVIDDTVRVAKEDSNQRKQQRRDESPVAENGDDEPSRDADKSADKDADKTAAGESDAGKDGENEMRLDDYLTLAMMTIRRILEQKIESGGEKFEIDDLFDDIEHVLSLSPDDSTGQQIIAGLRGTARELLIEPLRLESPVIKSPQEPAPPVEALEVETNKRNLQEFAEGTSPLVQLQPSGAELFCILVQYVRKAGHQVHPRILDRLRECLDEETVKTHREVFTGAVHDICLTAETEVIDAVIPIIARAFEDHDPDGFAALILDVADPLSDEKLSRLWPFVMRGLLVAGAPANVSRQSFLIRILATIPGERLRQEQGRLTHCLQNLPAASPYFQLPKPTQSLLPMYDALLDTPLAKELQSQILNIFRIHPLASPAGSACVAISEVESGALRFLTDAIQEILSGKPNPTLPKRAAHMIGRRLRRLNPSERINPSVQASIRSLGRIPCDEAIDFLQEIRQRRRKVVLYEWPPSCRQAAKLALNDARALQGSFDRQRGKGRK